MNELSSAEQGYAVTPSDSVNFVPGKCKAIYVGGAGNIVAIMAGSAVTFTAVPVGETLWIAATRVNATGTTATGLVALY